MEFVFKKYILCTQLDICTDLVEEITLYLYRQFLILFAQIYPGAECYIGKKKLVIEKVIYVNINHFRITCSNSPMTKCLYLNNNTYTMKWNELDVKLISPPANHIMALLEKSDLEDFGSFTENNMSNYFQFLFDFTFNKKRWLQTVIPNIHESKKKYIHGSYCHSINYYNEGYHICCEKSFLTTIMTLLFGDNTLYHINNEYIGGIIIENKQIYYIAVHPGSIKIIGSYGGHGTCFHPLSRLIFLAILVKKDPKFTLIFNMFYLQKLFDDLIDENYINEKILINQIISLRDLLDYLDMNNINRSHYSFYRDDFLLQLMMVGILNNGWQGSALKGLGYFQYNHVNFFIEFEKETRKFDIINE